jgi:hypothetical protein
VARNGTERYEHGWKRNGLRHGTGTGTVLFRVRVLTVSCPAFRKISTARHGMVKALDTERNGGHDTERDTVATTRVTRMTRVARMTRVGTGRQRVETDRHGASSVSTKDSWF